jgi:hypothetical protein
VIFLINEAEWDVRMSTLELRLSDELLADAARNQNLGRVSR